MRHDPNPRRQRHATGDKLDFAIDKPATNRMRYPGLLALVGGSILIWWHPLTAALQLALSSDAHTHILLILPLSIALIYIETRGFRATFEPRRWMGTTTGAILLSGAALFRGLAAWNIWHLSSSDRLSLNMFALVIWWIASVILCLGLQTLRSFLFPLCFLFLIVPFPESLLRSIIEFLQHWSALGADILFRIAQVPVMRDGTTLSIPGLDIEVAPECSSIRSSMMLLVTTVFLSRLFLRAWWKQALLIVATIPLSVAKNALRIFTIVELGTRVDSGFLDGELHHSGGILFFGFAVAVVGALLWVLSRGELRTPLIVDGIAENRTVPKPQHVS